MFCPKCGLENADETKFCRGCGAELTRVLASLEPGKKKPKASLAERSIALYSRGVRGILTGIAFIIVSILVSEYGERDKVWWLVPFTLALLVFAGSVSRLVQGFALKRLADREARDGTARELTPGREEYVHSKSSVFDTDDLAASPFSVTERTTNLLRRFDEDDE